MIFSKEFFFFKKKHMSNPKNNVTLSIKSSNNLYLCIYKERSTLDLLLGSLLLLYKQVKR